MVIKFDCWKKLKSNKLSSTSIATTSSSSTTASTTSKLPPPLPFPRHINHKYHRHHHQHHNHRKHKIRKSSLQHHQQQQRRSPTPDCYCSCHRINYHHHHHHHKNEYCWQSSPPIISVKKFHHLTDYHPTTATLSSSSTTLNNNQNNSSSLSSSINQHHYSSLLNNQQNTRLSLVAESIDSASSSIAIVTAAATITNKQNSALGLATSVSDTNNRIKEYCKNYYYSTSNIKQFELAQHQHQHHYNNQRHEENKEQDSYYSDIIYDHPTFSSIDKAAIITTNTIVDNRNNKKIKSISSSLVNDKKLKSIQLILIRLDLFKFATMEPLQVNQRLIVFSLVDTFTKLSPNKILENYIKKIIQEQQHNGHFIAVFNLSEPLQSIFQNNEQLLNVQFFEFGWPERRSPSLERLCSLCKSLDLWLTQNDENLAIIYSKRDLSRASLCIAVFLQYVDICLGSNNNNNNSNDIDSNQSQLLFDFETMYNYYHYNLEAYLQPSQKKYINYFKTLLNGDSHINCQKLYLNQLLIHQIPNFDGCGKCRPFIKIYQDWQLLYSSSVVDIDNEFINKWNSIIFDIHPPLKLRGEILIKCFHKVNSPLMKIEMFSFQFHTGTLTSTSIKYNKSDLDCAVYDRRLSDNMQVELIFSNDDKTLNQIVESDQLLYHYDDDSPLIRCNSYENFFNLKMPKNPEQYKSNDNISNKQLEYTKGPLDGSLYATVLKKPTSVIEVDVHEVNHAKQEAKLQENSQKQKPTNMKDEIILDDLINELFTEIQSFPDVQIDSNSLQRSAASPLNNIQVDESFYDFLIKSESLEHIQNEVHKENIDPIPHKEPSSDEDYDWLQRQQEKLRTIRSNRPKQAAEQLLIAELKTAIKPQAVEPPTVPKRTSSRALFFNYPFDLIDENDDYGIIHKLQNGNVNYEAPIIHIDEVDSNNNQENLNDTIAEMPINSTHFIAGLKSDPYQQQLRSSTPAFPVRHKNKVKIKSNEEENQHNLPMFIQDTSPYWYKRSISREEAVRYLHDRPPGSFIIRDSNSFPNAYGLAVRVSPEDARPDSGEPVRHFLIESTNKGVRIKGCPEEPVFSSLAALVYQHSITKISLPTRLIIPSADDFESTIYGTLDSQNGSDNNLLLKQFYDNGAACNVLYFITNDVESLTGAVAIKKTIDILMMNNNHRNTNDRKNKLQPAVIHFKASSKGITLTDNSHRLFFRQHYPLKTISFCSIDPENRSWQYSSEHNQIQSFLFGFVTRKKSQQLENECLIFGHYEHDQPPHAIVDFVNKLLYRSF